MEVRQLRYFVAVAEARSFTGAARQLHLSQQALSAAIRQLEVQLGCPLLERTSQRVELTAAGRALLAAAPAALDGMQTAQAAAQQAAGLVSGPLRVRYGLDAEHLVAPVLRGFAERQPAVGLEAWSGTDADNLRNLREGAVDGIFGWCLDDEPGVDVTDVAEETAMLVLPAGHPLATHDIVPVGLLAAEVLLLFPRQAAPAVWARLVDGLGPARVVELPTTGYHAVVAAVLDGAGLAPVTAGLASGLVHPGLVARPIEGAPSFALHLAWSRPPLPALRALLDHVALHHDSQGPAAPPP